ncbi:MAG TPA: hypothetical protein VLL08_19475 [Kineosporiaceae bacterium]|nr:hypothetical protein [Kineosporiaceae bacterium]
MLVASVPAARLAGGMVVSTGLDCDLGSRCPHLRSRPVLTGSRVLSLDFEVDLFTGLAA